VRCTVSVTQLSTASGRNGSRLTARRPLRLAAGLLKIYLSCPCDGSLSAVACGHEPPLSVVWAGQVLPHRPARPTCRDLQRVARAAPNGAI
jgi:hypothetical protein